MDLLDVRDLAVRYPTRGGAVGAVDRVSLTLQSGEVLGVVGESGCGKTTLALALMGLLPDTAQVEGEIHFSGRDLARLPARELRRVRWSEISMIFQGAMNALNPVYTVGEQIVEAILTHEPHLRERDARARVAELYEAVGLAPDRRDQYPHQYSGGMKQRAVIAMALACNPKLVIADEPTTALDVIVQDRILRELRRIQSERQLSMLYISHDMAVIAEMADVVAVMYAGRIVEMGPTAQIFAGPVHPYTAALMASSPSLRGLLRRIESLPGAPPNLARPPAGCRFHPRCPRATAECATDDPTFEPRRDGLAAACWHQLPWDHLSEAAARARVPEGPPDTAGTRGGGGPDEPGGSHPPPSRPTLVQIDEVRKHFPVGQTLFFAPRGVVRAVDEVSLDIREGETFGLVGESGSGKTTLGRLLVRLEEPTEGGIRVRVNGAPVELGAIERTELRRNVQMIFQDPYESLNPRMTIGQIVAEPLRVLRLEEGDGRDRCVAEILDRVGLAPGTFLPRYPHELSGGQRQRVAIARAMIVRPRFVVADEPTSMLDVSVRAGILELLAELKRDMNVTYLYVTHDLAVARYLCDRIGVMYRGKIVELGGTEEVLQRPLHPYTRALIAAVPVPDPTYRRPDPAIGSGGAGGSRAELTCLFLDRCPVATDYCRSAVHPPLEEHREGHRAACYEVREGEPPTAT